MTPTELSNVNRQCEILKKRISRMILKENSIGLNSHEILLKQAAIRQFYQLSHLQLHR